MTKKNLKRIFLTTDLRVEGNLRVDFYEEQNVLDEYKIISDSLSRNGF